MKSVYWDLIKKALQNIKKMRFYSQLQYYLFVFPCSLQSEDPMLVKDVELARFCLALLSVKGRMFSDGSMHTSVLLVDCTLDDTRPGRGAKITR